MTRENDAYIEKMLDEFSEEISFKYEVSTDTMFFSEKYKTVYGRKNKVPHFLKYVKKEYGLSVESVNRLEEFKRILDYGDLKRYIQVQWPDKNGKYEWCEVVFRHVIDKLGNVLVIGIWRNIDRQKREQVMIRHQVLAKEMNGVHNRQDMETLLNGELLHIGIGDVSTLFLLDFDNMEEIRSSFGVLAAEELLHLYAKELLLHFHEDGIVGHVGSDKFLVYLRQVKEQEAAKMLAKRMQRLLKNICVRLQLSKEVTTCIGVTVINQVETFKEVLNQADIALRHGKNKGKNQIVFYNQGMQSEKYVKKLSVEKEKDKGKSIYDAGKIWPDLLSRLYQNRTTHKGVEEAIEFIGHLFHLDKIMVWEYDMDFVTISNTHQWTNVGIKNTKELAQKINFLGKDADFSYNEEGIAYYSDVTKESEALQYHANLEKMTALLQARMDGDGENLGYITFAMCSGARVWAQEEIDLLKLMSQVISENIRKRRMAKKMEDYYDNTKNILNNVVTGIYVVDQDNYELYYYNEVIKTIFPMYKSKGKCYECFFNRESKCENCLLDSLKTGVAQENTKTCLVYSQANDVQLEVKATKMLWENKKNAFILTINEHLATPEEMERKKKQEYLEKRYAFIYSHSCDCIFDIDIENDFYEATIIKKEAMWDSMQMSGKYTNLYLEALACIAEREDQERFRHKFSIEGIQRSIRRGELMLTDSFAVNSRSGNLHCKEIRAFILNENGKISVVATYCDVTEQKRKDMQNFLERQKLNRAVLNVYPVVMSVNVTKNEYTVMSQENMDAQFSFMGNIFSNTILDLAIHTHPEERDRFIAAFDRENLKKEFADGKNEISIELRQMYRDGKYHWISLMCIRIDNPLNEDLLIYIFVRDIDKQKNMQQSLKDALTTAERASVAKSDFLSRMSHEIRTPMNAIIGMNELAKTVINQPDSLEKYINKIDGSAKYLLSLINNILDMSRIESNKVVIEKKEFSMHDLLSNIQNMIGSQAKAKGIRFEIEKKGEFDCEYLGDTLRINQILINLLSNAVKFTDKGGTVTLSVKENRREPGESYVCFRISDTGIGMSEEFMQTMYNPFEQENAASAKGMVGTGLGLSITKNLITLMDGHIKCKSKKGEGTTFIVEMKMDVVDKKQEMCTTSPKEVEPVDKTKALIGKRILLVEDNELNQEIAVALLEMQQIKVDCVDNGELAVQKFLETGDFYYDMILMDIRMPVKNGLDATADIRAIKSKYAEEIPIVAMSANAFSEDKAKAFANGMTDYLVKPIDVKLMVEVLVKYLV